MPSSRNSVSPDSMESPADLRFTICVLAYGPHCALAKRFLQSLYYHTDPASFDLRVGLNEVEPATEKLFRGFQDMFGNITIFRSSKNIFKSPMMRRMFWEKPLETDWTIWCDDDAQFTKSDWLQRLTLKIQCQPRMALWGRKAGAWRTDPALLEWFKSRPWFNKLSLKRSKAPSGKVEPYFEFATGGFWAVQTQVLQKLNWPDPTLVHCHEDIVLGEALRQNGLRFAQFNYGVDINAAPRRNADAGNVSGFTTINSE